MATITTLYGAETALTWAGAIGSSPTAGRQSNTIDNTTTKAVDYQVSISIVYPNSAPGGGTDKTVYIYAGGWYGSTNGWQGRPQLSGSDGSYTFNDITTTPPALQPCRGFYMVQNTTGLFVIPSLATVFGGSLPEKVAFAEANYSGQTITTFSCTYRSIIYTVA